MDQLSKTENFVVEFPLSILKGLGFYSTTQTKRLLAITTLNSAAIIFLEIVALLQFASMKGNVSEYVLNSEACSTFAQLFGKTLATALNQQNLTQLLQYTTSFWNTRKCTGAAKVSVDNITNRIILLQKVYVYGASVFVPIMCISPLFGRTLPLGVWAMEGRDGLRKVVLGVQVVVWIFYVFFITAFDCLYLGFSVNVIIQFRILAHCLKHLHLSEDASDRSFYDELNVCVRHHIYLLRYCRRFQYTYSSGILVGYATSAPLVCLEMYGLLESNSAVLAGRHGLIVILAILQVAFYCVPADLIVSEAEAVSNAMYSSDWYLQHYTVVRNPVTLILQKSQQPITFRPGGLVEMNITVLVSVLRVSWSVCTVMRGLKTNQ